MNEVITDKPCILTCTSSYPSDRSDIYGGGLFLFDIVEKLSEFYNMVVLAPGNKKYLKYSKIYENGRSVEVYRPCFLFSNILNPFYGDGIFQNIRNNPFLLLNLPFYFISQMVYLSNLVISRKINVIHVHWLFPQGLLCALYKSFFNKNINIVLTCHGSDVNSLNNDLINRLKAYILNRANVVTCVSQDLSDKAHSFGCKKEIQVFPMGVDTPIFSKNQIDQENGGTTMSRLLFVGSLIEDKGVRYLLEAFRILVGEGFEGDLKIVGDGYLRKELENTYKDLIDKKRVNFLGYVPRFKLPEIYKESDIFILASKSEGYPGVLMEAMSAGLIPIITDLPTYNDLKIQGLVRTVKYGNTEELASKITTVSSMGASATTSLSQSIIQYAKGHFGVSVTIDRFRIIYQELI